MPEIDPRAEVSRSDLLYSCPVTNPVEGPPIGNGRMGTLVWTTPGALHFQVNRVDVFAVNRNTAGSRAPAATDYGGCCAQAIVRFEGEPFRAGPMFRQHLSLYDARCTVEGDGVQACCWVSADTDALFVTLTATRLHLGPIEVWLQMWCAPLVERGAHSAAYRFFDAEGSIGLLQTYREADHFCSSAVVAGAPGAVAARAGPEPRVRLLRLPDRDGKQLVVIASAATMEEQVSAGAAAATILDTAARRALTDQVTEHESWWHGFWGRTYVRARSRDGIAEAAIRQRTLLLYHMAATSRGVYPPKWNGSVFLTRGDARGWGTQYWVWTTEMLYWPLLAADASDLCEPYFEMFRRQIPALETAARQRWGAAGIFVPETVPFDGPVSLPEDLAPEYRDILLHGKGCSHASRELAALCQFDFHLSVTLASLRETGCDGYCYICHVASSAAELAVHAWWRYRCTGDTAWLRSHAYPLLRGVAEFYRTFCREEADGRWHIHGTNAHEDFWAVSDSIMDLAAIRGAIPLAIRAAGVLGVDAELQQRWRQFLDGVAAYPMGADPRAKALTGGALAEDAWAAGFKGQVDGSHNSEDVQLTPIFPFEDWTGETRDPAMDAVARRTLEVAPRHRVVLGGAALNTAIRSPIAAVRAGMTRDVPSILERYTEAFSAMQNGFSLFEQVFPGTESHSIEHLGLVTMVLQESLLQSVSARPGEPEIISLFPAWPLHWDAEFRLLARGGFLVSASLTAGKVQFVEIHSRLGEQCRMRNWWGRRCILRGPEGEGARLEGDVVVFDTVAGKTYRLFEPHAI